MNCKNCGQIVKGNYCSHCGQKSSVSRITRSSFLNELSESTFQINRGFFYTLKELFIRPGKSIQEYLDGKRKKHFKPIAYLLTFSTIYLIISQISSQNTWTDDLVTGFSLGGSGKEEMPTILVWIAKNYTYTTLILLPVFSFASFLCFKRLGRNYFEHSVINSYITGQQAIFYTLFALLKKYIESEVLEVVPIIIATSYTFWVYSQLSDKERRIKVLLRSSLTYLLYLILSTGMLALIMGITEIIN